MPMPESIEMYPGTRGSTQGERKETNPARKAPRSETSVIRCRSSRALFRRAAGVTAIVTLNTAFSGSTFARFVVHFLRTAPGPSTNRGALYALRRLARNLLFSHKMRESLAPTLGGSRPLPSSRVGSWRLQRNDLH